MRCNMKHWGLLALIAGVLLPASALAQAPKETYPQVLHLQGKLYQPAGQEWAEIPPKEQIKSGTQVQVGAAGTAGDPYKKPGILQEQTAILSFTPQDVVILPLGSKAQMTLEAKLSQYRLQGFATLILRPQASASKFQLNGLPMETKAGALLYLVSNEKMQQWTLVEGEVTTWLPAAKDTKAAPTKVILRTGERITQTGEDYALERNPEYQDAQYQAAQRPGFTQLGAYAQVGYAGFDGKGLTVVRLGKEALLTGSPVPLFAGDEVKTQAGQKAQLELFPEDLIRLEANTAFTLPPAEAAKEKTINFNFIGAIRVKAGKRDAARSAQFRSVTATIGIKGTDFFAAASSSGTEVGTLEGLVGVSDPQGQGEVLVEPGMQTKVNKSEAPQKPEKIPPQRLQELGGTVPKAAILADLVGRGPQVWPPYSLEQAPFKEGDPIQFAFDQPVESLSIKLKGKDIPAALSADKLSATLDSPALFAAAAKQPQVGLEFATKGVNQATHAFAKTLRLQLKPDKPPVLSLPEGKASLRAQRFNELFIGADREIAQWDVTLNGKATTPTAPPTTPPPALGGETKPGLALAGGWLSALTSGSHSLSVKGKDSFGLESEALSLTLVVEQDAPLVVGAQVTRRPNSALQPLLLGSLAEPAAPAGAEKPAPKPLALDNLELREGEALALQVNKPALEAQLQVQGQSLILTPDETKTQFSAKPEDWARLFASESKFTLRLRDELGNEQSYAGSLTLKFPQPALLSWGFVGDRLLTKGDQDLPLQSDRGIERWELLLNGKAVSLQELPLKPPFAAQTKLALPASLFKDLPEGDSQLQVTAWDDFQKPASLRLTLTLDRRAPQLMRLVPTKHLEWLTLKDGERLQLEFDEPLHEVKASLGGQQWKLELSPDKRSVLLEAGAGMPGIEVKALQIEVSDALGNATQLQGWAKGKAVGTGPLQEAYDQTSLRQGVGEVDQSLLLLRLPFDPSVEKAGQAWKH